MDIFSNIWGFLKEYSGIFASIPVLIYSTNPVSYTHLTLPTT
ncbi:hypothetical protein DSM16313_26700 [Acinetobacter seohaensis]|nr:hypothetical protein DSM16313_26700 [Acinetobacter seohaensis]